MKAPGMRAAAAATYATNLATATLSLVNVLIVARALGAAGRGDVAFLIAVATVTGWLAGLSVQEANANLAGTEPSLRRRLATNSVLLALALGAAAAVLVAGLAEAVPGVGGEVERSLLWATLAALPLVLLRASLSLLAQADFHFGVTNAAWLAGPVTTVLLNGGLALAGELSVGSAIGAWIAGQALGVLILAVHTGRHAGFGRPELATTRRMLGFGARVHVSRSMTVGNYRADQWLVGSLAGSRELGVYSVAVAWAEAMYYLPGVLVLVQRPHLVRASRAAAARLAARVLRTTLLLAAVLAAALALAAPVLCGGLFGPEFADAAAMLRILALAAFGIAAVELLSGALIAQRLPLAAGMAAGAAFALTLALNVALVPAHGGLGAAVARALAATAGGAVAAIAFSRALGAPLRDLVPRPAELRRLLAMARRRPSPPSAPSP